MSISIVLSFSREDVAEYFNIDVDKIDIIYEDINNIVMQKGHHSITEQLEIIDDEYPDSGENLYAKFCYGVKIGQIMSHVSTQYVEGGVQ